MRMRQTNPRIALGRISGYEWLMAFMKRVRLDDELISQGICADRADALRLLWPAWARVAAALDFAGS